MAFETFAQRKRRESRGGAPVVYVYDEMPEQLRRQIGIALSEGIGTFNLSDRYGLNIYASDNEDAYERWKEMDRACRKEIHAYRDYIDGDHYMDRVLEALYGIEDIDEVLSIVEMGCIILDMMIDKEGRYADSTQSDTAAEALAEINRRFDQHGFGYQFESGRIIRKDSEFMHAEGIKPALSLLSAPDFAKANEDFMTAHQHYRAGNFKDAVTAANRAFETMLKIICDLEHWTYGGGDRAKELVTLVNNNGLFTRDFDKGLETYVAMLKTGLPTVRNNAGGHGEGLAAKAVTSGMARFAINLTASNIVLLGDSYAALKAGQSK